MLHERSLFGKDARRRGRRRDGRKVNGNSRKGRHAKKKVRGDYRESPRTSSFRLPTSVSPSQSAFLRMNAGTSKSSARSCPVLARLGSSSGRGR